MSAGTLPRPVARFTDRTLTSLAIRAGLAAASRITVGCLTVVLPNGRKRVFGDPTSERRAEFRVHDESVALRMILHGEVGMGEAYMDGLWSSPDLLALIELAALNRSALTFTKKWWRLPLEAPAPAPAPGTAQHEGPGPPEHLGPLRPGQRLLPAVPGRDDDLLQRRVRVAGAVARGRPAEQVPPARRGRGPDRRDARPGDRVGLGRLRAVRGRGAGLPGDLDHHLRGAARPRPGAGPGGRAGAPGGHPAPRLPRHQRPVRRDRVDRDAGGRGRRVLHGVLRGRATGRCGRAEGWASR